MAMDMRALYYVALSAMSAQGVGEAYVEEVKANENNLNQNFAFIAQKIDEMEARLSALE